jgi:hypothetical protein
MANVNVIISKAIKTRTFASPIIPGASDADPLPVNPDGLVSGSSTYIALTDTDNSYVGNAGKIPIVNNSETGLEFGSVASATNHNDLASIQGGAVGEYYHLTEDEYDAILNTPNTADSLNPFATIADIGAMGGGTVTSVALTAPSIFSVSGSPVTTSGTLALTLANQSGFTVFARESGTGTPSFQALLQGHIPNIPISKVTGLQSALDLKLGVGLVSGNIFVGNASNIAAGVTLSLNATGGTFGLSNAGVLTFPNASGSARGLLTSEDWTTFNGKQDALTNPITGTGTAGQVSFWTGTNTQSGDANLFWNNTDKRLGIGTTSPSFPLDVIGNIRASNTGIFSRVELSISANSSEYLGRLGTAYMEVTRGSANAIGTLSFFTGNNATPAERMRITSGGNVGIGTTSPSARLDVNGNINLVGNVLMDSSADRFVGTGTSNSDSYISFLFSAGIIRFNTPTNSLYSFNMNGIQIARFNPAGVFANSVLTSSPTGGIARRWKLGDVTTGTVTPNRLVRVEINGVAYNLIAIQI